MKNLLLNGLAFGAIASSLLVITSPNPVLAVIFLISVFFHIAGYLILTGVEFIGISYILLYVGAITVLFLFVIMMINIKLTDILEIGSQYTQNFPLAFAIGSLFLYVIYSILPFQFNTVDIISRFSNSLEIINAMLLNMYNLVSYMLFMINPSSVADIAITSFLQISAIGHNLYTFGAALLIVCSMLLLLAMIAIIFISRKNK